MTKWEYCAVAGIQRSREKLISVYSALWEFGPPGVTARQFGGDPAKERDEIGRTIARLGEEGWELAGVGNLDKGDGHVLYFKRPKV